MLLFQYKVVFYPLSEYSGLHSFTQQIDQQIDFSLLPASSYTQKAVLNTPSTLRSSFIHSVPHKYLLFCIIYAAVISIRLHIAYTFVRAGTPFRFHLLTHLGILGEAGRQCMEPSTQGSAGPWASAFSHFCPGFASFYRVTTRRDRTEQRNMGRKGTAYQDIIFYSKVPFKWCLAEFIFCCGLC